jgi:hypothetical protein
MADRSLPEKLRDVDSFERPTLAKVVVLVSILPAAGVGALVADSLPLDYGARAAVTMILTAGFMGATFVAVAIVDDAVWGA